MPRIARVVVPGMPHHVTQRGNRRANVFFDDGDRRRYLLLLEDYARKYGLSVWAYCLMSNHVHFVAVPASEDALGRSFRDSHQAYSSWLNRRLGESGHLWQGRFFSSVLDDAHLWACVRYVERNPVRAGLIARAEDWPWPACRRQEQRRRPLRPTDRPAAVADPDALAGRGLDRLPADRGREDGRGDPPPDDDRPAQRRRRLHRPTGRPAGANPASPETRAQAQGGQKGQADQRTGMSYGICPRIPHVNVH